MDEHPGVRSPDPPLAGLGRFALKVAAGTGLAVAAVLLGLRLWDGGPGGEPGIPDARPAARGAPAAPELDPVPLPRAASVAPLGDVARSIERRRDAGELAVAQRRFEPCAGGDLLRVAWFDARQEVLKLERRRADGTAIEEWFDEEGRLREALVRVGSAGGTELRHVGFDASGRLATPEPGAGGERDLPALVRGQPGAAFFAGAGCSR
jgi:hypothetical protein